MTWDWQRIGAALDQALRYHSVIGCMVLAVATREWVVPLFGIVIALMLAISEGKQSRERGWATVVCSVPGFVFRSGGLLISKEVGGSFMVGVYGLTASLCLLAVFGAARRGLEIGHFACLAMTLFYRFTG